LGEVLTDLKTRGVKDVPIACVDGMKGFPLATEAAFPQALVQLCIVRHGEAEHRSHKSPSALKDISSMSNHGCYTHTRIQTHPRCRSSAYSKAPSRVVSVNGRRILVAHPNRL
jgi:hypothetical protein